MISRPMSREVLRQKPADELSAVEDFELEVAGMRASKHRTTRSGRTPRARNMGSSVVRQVDHHGNRNTRVNMSFENTDV